METTGLGIATWIVMFVLFCAVVGLMLLGLVIFLVIRFRKH
jgi:hypothetical protein